MTKFFTILILTILSIAAYAAQNVAGTWQATVNGKSDPKIRIAFTPKGEFKFVGSGYSSCGTYKLDGDSILLTWTKVDGEAVKPGSMTRTLTLTPDNTFAIDRFTYARRA